MKFFKKSCHTASFIIAAGTALVGGLSAQASVPGYLYSDLSDFLGTNGSPQSKLLPDGMGHYYGLTGGSLIGGDSTLFEYTPSTTGIGGTVAVLKDFGPSLGSVSNQPSGLALGPNGIVYGTTQNGAGSLFQYTPGANGATGTVTLLHTFTLGSGGLNPRGQIVVDPAGNVFGATALGGTNEAGTLFQYTPGVNGAAGTFSTVYNFGGGDGSLPTGGVTAGPDGSLYGATTDGGANDDGTLFQYKPGTSSVAPVFTTLYNFAGGDGDQPGGALAVNASGTLFGTTATGGTSNDGTLFQFTPGAGGAAGTLTTLHNFTDDSDGTNPVGGVTLGAHGDLFGVNYGGVNGGGTVYKYTPSANGVPGVLSTLYSFSGADGSAPNVPVTLDRQGDVLGVTSAGGLLGNGVLFQLASAVQPRFDFDGDGLDDFLWRNASTGQLAIWDMNDATRLTSQTFAGSTDSNWQIVGVADFDGDGKPDILWQNAKTHQLAVWYMNGPTRVSDITFPGSTDSNWIVASANDFDGDGHPDLLWRNIKTGEVAVWYLGGTTGTNRLSDAYIETVPDLNWHIFGTGDYNGDGKPDILWQNVKTTEVGLWHMNNTTVIDKTIFATVGDPAWKIVGTEDADLSGEADILWQNAKTQQLAIWHLNDTTRTTTDAFASSTDPAWTIVGVH